MTREKQIQKAAEDHRDLVCCGFYDPIADVQQKSFVCDVKWADENPKQELISVDKACEWLECTIRPYAGYYGTASIVESFRKAMEE